MAASYCGTANCFFTACGDIIGGLRIITRIKKAIAPISPRCDSFRV